MRDNSRQSGPDYSSLLYSLEVLLSIAVFAFVLVWFYQAIRRIEKSLREIRERLGLSEKEAGPPGSNFAAPSFPEAKEIARISNLWGIPAILFIIAAFGGPSLGWTLDVDLLWAAGLMALVAAAWEVIRRKA
jgi:hypothetical protein